MALPQKMSLDMMQNTWATALNPVIANPIVQGLPINNILLNANTPKVIHIPLGRVQQGWIITDNLAFCQVKRTQPFNSQNLTLESDADTTISIWCY